MKEIINGRIVLPDRVVVGKALLFDGKIQGIVDEAEARGADQIDARGGYVAPGLVDMHIHGYLGADASDGDEAGIVKMADGIIKNGVTSWLPTTMTVSMDDLRRVFSLMRGLRERSQSRRSWTGAEILGVNAEGPFINPSKKGAQAGEHIARASAAFLKEYADIIKLCTIAPEMPGSLECIEEIARDTDIVISMGHTDASYEQAQTGIEKGVKHVTHLFNAMTPLNHRNPGVVGAALAGDVSVELIADCFHIHPGLFSLVERVKGDKLVLMTDCTRAGGLEDGEYTLGGQPIFVKGIECRLSDGTIAGSVLKLNAAVGNFMKHAKVPVWTAVNAASLTPARIVGEDKRKGSLEIGKDADILIANENFTIDMTIIAGEICYRREE